MKEMLIIDNKIDWLLWEVHMRLKEFMDMKKLQELQEQFSNATKMSVVIVEPSGNTITRESNETEFYSKYVKDKKDRWKKFLNVKNSSNSTCHINAGIAEFASDIVLEGERIGIILGGQVLTKEPDTGVIAEIAREFGTSRELCQEAVKKLPVKTEQEIKAAVELFTFTINQAVAVQYQNTLSHSGTNNSDTLVESALENIKKIINRTKQMEQIASKQKILTLNASIEGSRAGEAGAGFMVVAKKMGDLAQESVTMYHDVEELSASIETVMRKLSRMPK